MKTDIKQSIKRGFTLIELMIVIVILGILMGTILPRLTGAQGRARDVGRQADLNNIAVALEAYNSDNNEYPGTNGTDYCLTDGNTVEELIDNYMKGNSVPGTPTPNEISGGCSVGDEAYLYKPITVNGVPKGGYILVADMEIPENANALWSEVSTESDADDIAPLLDSHTVDEYRAEDEAGNGQDTVFVMLQ